MSRTPYYPYYTAQKPPPSRRPNRNRARLRELLFAGLALVIAAAVIGGIYTAVNHTTLPFGLLGGQPTAVPLKPANALAQIQRIYPDAAVSVTSPLSDEVDLVTIVQTSTAIAPTTTGATQILSTYMRGYSHQSFWRWIDTNHITQTRTTYEMHASELWVIAINLTYCSLNWTVYEITPATLIQRGVINQDYRLGIPSHPGQGIPPGSSSSC